MRSLLVVGMMFMNFSLLCQESSPLLCSDGIDNDGDGNIDCMDNECDDLPNNGCSTCFNDGSSFADVVLSYFNPCNNSFNTDPDAALGVSDYSAVESEEYVTLGDGGSIALEFSNNILINSGNNSADLWVFEIGPAVESSFVDLRPIPGSGSEAILIAEGIVDSDLDGFYEFGVITGSTSSIDIDNFLSEEYAEGALKFDAIRITDVPDGSCSGRTPGADIDAVCALFSIACESIFTEVNKNICSGEEYEGYTSSGVYIDTLFAESGCDSVRILNLTVSDLEIFDILNNSATCGDNNGLIEVIAEGGVGNLSYLMNDGENQSSNIFEDLPPNIYSIKVIDENECFLEEEVLIDNLTLPVEGEVIGDLTFCQGDSTILTAIGGGIYNWSTGDSTQSVSIKTAGEYNVTISNTDGCMDSIYLRVTTPELPNITIIGPSEICKGDTSFLSGIGGETYIWSTGDISPTVPITESGEYIVTGIDSFGCENKDSILVSIKSGFAIKDSCGQCLEPTDSNFNSCIDCKGAVNGSAETDLCGQCLEPQNPKFNNCVDCARIPFGSAMIDSCGQCLDPLSVDFQTSCYESLFIPSAFSPNGDGINDIFEIKGNDSLDFRLIIYDRWGKKIKTFYSLTDFWDGTMLNGKQAPEGVYGYRLNIHFESRESQKSSGSIILFR